MVRLKLCWCCRITFNLFMFCFFFKFVHFLYLFSRCNNQQNCDISAENSNFGGDPCPNIPKYLEVYFGCFDGKFFFISGNLRRYLTYFQDFVSFVLFHIFSFKLYPCHFLCQALFISRFMILDGSQWLFSFWDSFHLVLTFQSIKSKCIFLSLRSVILEGSWQLSFLRRCDERVDCSLNASLDIRLESDPCPGTEKYLEAHYVCHSLSEGPPTQGWSAEKLVKLHSDNLSSVMWCQSPSPPPPPPPPSYQHNNKYYTINIIICTSVGVKRELRNWYSNNWNGILQKQSWTALILNFNVWTNSH